MMSKDRVRVYIKRLVESQIVTKSESGYQIHESWEQNLQILIDSLPLSEITFTALGASYL